MYISIVESAKQIPQFQPLNRAFITKANTAISSITFINSSNPIRAINPLKTKAQIHKIKNICIIINIWFLPP